MFLRCCFTSWLGAATCYVSCVEVEVATPSPPIKSFPIKSS